MAKSEEAFVFKLVKRTEEKFGVICFAHHNWNTSKTNVWWDICIDDYPLYMDNEEYKKWMSNWRKLAKARNIGLLFCYCNPNENKLAEYAEEGTLILNV